jgi:hypothetical protein
MRRGIQLVGLLMLLEGVSGTIDRLAWQPLFGIVLNAFNRFVIPRIDALKGYEVFANLILAALGGVIVIAAERMAPAN